jgi:hypothetical protein
MKGNSMIWRILCFFGLHFEAIPDNDITKGSVCACGKRRSPPIQWPVIPSQRREFSLLQGDHETTCCGLTIGSRWSYCPDCGKFLW